MFNLSSKFLEQYKRNREKRRWWLFNATDFQSLMYPCFIFCRILGLFPYKINSSSFETSKLYYILSITITCVNCCCTLIIICVMNICGWFDGDIRRAIEYNLFYLSGSFIVIVTLVLSAPRIRLLRTIIKISARLPSEVFQKQSILIHTKDILCFSFLFVHTLISGYISKSSRDSVLMLCTLYISLLLFQMDMLYINCVCILKACFKRINDDLTNLFIVYDGPHLVRFFCHKQRNPLLLKKLNSLKKRHLMISDAVQMLNVTFSPQLLATVTLTFIHVSLELYDNMVQWHNGLFISWTNDTHRNRMVAVPYVICYLIKMVLIAWACETGKNQATKIKTIVHEVRNSTNDEQLKNELRLFSLQIMHRDNTFSSKGLTLDATLLTAMVGTISTYVLILIQFLITYHSCEKRNAINVTQTI